MQDPQSNLEEKVNPSILKDVLSSRTDPFIFTSIAPVFLDRFYSGLPQEDGGGDVCIHVHVCVHICVCVCMCMLNLTLVEPWLLLISEGEI